MSSVHSADPDTFSNSFIRDSSSSSSSPINQQESSTHSHSRPQQIQPEHDTAPSQTNMNAFVNGHVRQVEEEHPRLLSHAHEEQVARDRGHDTEDDPDLVSGVSDGDWYQYDMDPETRRVKLYELIGQTWTDRGTAYCQYDYNEETRQARLITRAENTDEILLERIIHTSDVYRRQLGTSSSILWTEPDGTDYALSFENIEGCGEVWEFICQVQRHLQDTTGSRHV